MHTECSSNSVSQIPGFSAIYLRIKLLVLHEKVAHGVPTTLPLQAEVAPARTRKYAWPNLILKDGMVAEEEWEFFLYDWNEFKHLANAGERSYALSWIRVSTNSTVL